MSTNQQPINDETYVYDGREVKKTGRTAVRNIRSTASTRRRIKQPAGPSSITLIEIVPIDGVAKLPIWVEESELFHIITPDNDNQG